MERKEFTPEQEERIDNTVRRILADGPKALKRAQDIADYCLDLMNHYNGMPREFKELERITKPLQEAIRRAEFKMERTDSK